MPRNRRCSKNGTYIIITIFIITIIIVVIRNSSVFLLLFPYLDLGSPLDLFFFCQGWGWVSEGAGEGNSLSKSAVLILLVKMDWIG